MSDLLSKEKVIWDYGEFKSVALELAGQNNFQESLKYVEICAKIAYNFNFIHYDTELESVLTSFSAQLFSDSTFTPKAERVVFYDYFGFDNKGLTQQYIRALISWDVEFLYILEEGENISSGRDILKELEQYSKASILLVKGTNPIQKMIHIRNAIIDFKPERAFLHFVPWDIVGVCVWNSLPIVKRFLINLTDHAFWLGKSCSDYFLEFRNYGYIVSLQSRNIPAEKLLLQPYYPIQSNTLFQGFPIDISGKVIGFSGSAYYKVGGRKNKFLELVKRILDENENFVFFFAGSGNDKPIKKFIKEQRLDERFILLGSRKDINEVCKRIDLFINTFPFIGGLMTQLAVLNNKAIATYTTPDLPFNFIEDLLGIDKSKAGSIKNEDDFLIEVNRLIRDPGYRLKNIESYKNSVPTVQQFNDSLKSNVYDLENRNFKPSPLEIDHNAVFELYIETENEFLKSYDVLKLNTLNRSYFKRFPLKAIYSIIKVLKNHPEILINFVKKAVKLR